MVAVSEHRLGTAGQPRLLDKSLSGYSATDMSRAGKIDPAISRQLARDIREIAKRAHNEEEVRIPVESALKPVLSQLGISTQASYEQKLTMLRGTGYADAVYGFGVIEYERQRSG